MGHTAWPTIVDLNSIASAMNQTFGTSVSAGFQQNMLDSVIESVTRRTHQTFIPVTETRYFNGSGTGEIEIDSFITISTVNVVGMFGLVPGMEITGTNPVTRNTFPQTKLQIYRGSLPAYYRVYLDRFPLGRSNIEINALWGYDTTIPADLWMGVAYQAAGVLLNLKSYQSDGYLVKWEDADVTEVRNHMDPFKFFKTGYTFKDLIRFYSKSAASRIDKTNKTLF